MEWGLKFIKCWYDEKRVIWMKNTIRITAKNQVGVLVRITGMLVRLGASLNHMTVNEDKTSNLYTIKLIINCEETIVKRIENLIEKQVDVVEVNVTGK